MVADSLHLEKLAALAPESRSELDNRIAILSASVVRLAGPSLAYEELGTANGFHAADELRISYLGRADFLLRSARTRVGDLDEVSRAYVVDTAERLLGILDVFRERIEQLVKNGVFHDRYPRERNTILLEFREKLSGLNERLLLTQTILHTHDLFNRVIVAKQDVGDRHLEALDSMVGASKERVDEIARLAAAAEKYGTSLTANMAKAGFAEVGVRHKRYSYGWAVIFAGALWFIWQAVSDTLNTPVPPAGDIPWLVSYLFHRVIALTVPSVVARMALVKYNAERHLSIIYSHRLAAINQLNVLVETMQGDAEASNRLRVELAKLMFADPQTGYMSESASEFNVSPVIQILEGTAKKAASG